MTQAQGAAFASRDKLLAQFQKQRQKKLGTKVRSGSAAADKKKILRLLAEFDERTISERMDAYFFEPDPYVIRNAYPLGLFIYRFDRYAPNVMNRYKEVVEAKKKRDALSEDPGKFREQKSSDPKSITELLKEWKR